MRLDTYCGEPATVSLMETTPLPNLSAADLTGLASYFAAEPAAVSVNIERDGVTTVVRRRDLEFIHSVDASRFGGSIALCPFCSGRMGVRS